MQYPDLHPDTEGTADPVSLVLPTPDLHGPLRAVARRIFTETFASLYDTIPFADFCDRTYGPGGSMDRGLHNPAVDWRMALVAGQPIGYAKLTPLRAPFPTPCPGALELQQLYVLSDWHGRGVAERLMAWALAAACARGAPEIYLTVFDHNARAKRFYARHGFTEVGRCTFTLGTRVDDDRVWRRTL